MIASILWLITKTSVEIHFWLSFPLLGPNVHNTNWTQRQKAACGQRPSANDSTTANQPTKKHLAEQLPLCIHQEFKYIFLTTYTWGSACPTRWSIETMSLQQSPSKNQMNLGFSKMSVLCALLGHLQNVKEKARISLKRPLLEGRK